MADARFRILPTLLLEPYRQAVAVAALERYAALEDSELSVEASRVPRRISTGWRTQLSFGQTRRPEERILERSIRPRGNDVWPHERKCELQEVHSLHAAGSRYFEAPYCFYTSVSAVYSSKIEGEDIELDSYVKHKRFGISFLPDHTQKIDDLYVAYQFAKVNPCDRANLLEAHRMLTRHILPAGRGGRVRTGNMYVTTPDGRIEYVAAAPHAVEAELDKFYADLALLATMDLTLQEVFFFAALLHLVFVKIHPFDDGNGRCARLLEKWFLAEKLGAKAWLIQSEKNYYLQHHTYYTNIRLLGLEYDTLDYSAALPFLRMLPASLTLDLPAA